MQYISYKDSKRRKFFIKQEYVRYKFKYFFSRFDLCTYFKYNFLFKFSLLSNNSNVIFFNRCIFSDRSKGLIHLAKLSRSYFKLYVSKSTLRGISRSRY